MQTKNLEKIFMWFEDKISVMIGAGNDEKQKNRARKQNSALHMYLGNEHEDALSNEGN